jgi:hypothetical protein
LLPGAGSKCSDVLFVVAQRRLALFSAAGALFQIQFSDFQKMRTFLFSAFLFLIP